MKTPAGTRPRTLVHAILLLALLDVGVAAESADSGSDDLRVSESRYRATGGRSDSPPDRVSTDTVEVGGDKAKARNSVAAGKEQRSVANGSPSPNTDFWFYSADVLLYADDDGDGYFHGLDLLFDADTYFSSATVYAVAYLSLDGGAWVEYAQTDTFSIYGATSDDEYGIVTELLSGYPTGSYDILLELYDAWDDSFVADFGPANSSELSYQPLEDAARDTPVTATRTIVVSEGGGGGADPLALAILAVVAMGVSLLRRRDRRLAPTAPYPARSS